MEGFFVLDSESDGIGDITKADNMAKKSSLGSVARKSLSDITNFQQGPKSPGQDEKPRPVSSVTKDYVEQLRKENTTLMQLLLERNKIVELSGHELQKLRINLQKMQQQNWHLAQANSQMLAELNLGKDRLKALQHELGCKKALLNAKNSELEEKMNKNTCQKTGTEEGKAKNGEGAGKSLPTKDDNKPCNPNRRRQSRNQSMCQSTVIPDIGGKEKVDNKRLCLRRHSARFKSEQPEPTEDWSKIEDDKFPVCPLMDEPKHEDGSTLLGFSTRKEEKGGRLSIGRPSRRAAEKVQSYKEIPINSKMRRPE